MGFTGRGTIIVGDKGEYGRRLVRYLEDRIPPSLHLRRCTCAESFCSCREAECYLLNTEFYASLPDSMREFLSGRKMMLITPEEEEGSFCQYHNPEELLDFINSRTAAPRAGQGTGEAQGVSEEGTPCRITALYSPVYDSELQAIARKFMHEGSLYLGVEDLGSSDSGRGDMGDLCYYIHLREDNILNILDEMVFKQDGIAFLDSPDMYFYLKELTAEDYRWFFEKLRGEGTYEEIFLGAGNGFVTCPESLSYFDRVILVDSENNGRQNAFCGRLETVMKEASFYSGTVERIYREAILFAEG